ncbi:hypothetical protein VTL71DRAFT_8110 [Oculimacula yallundae]|uniref:SET domain-containing protein n=1 Tax=Oculimacula yallundae TaxID=86028 RepID=A0ABR4CWV8_9HELO
MSPTTDPLQHLMNILGNEFTNDLNSLASSSSSRSLLQVKINAEICIQSQDSDVLGEAHVPQIHKGSININVGELEEYLRINANGNLGMPTPARSPIGRDGGASPSSTQSQLSETDFVPAESRRLQRKVQSSDSQPSKRRKTAGALQVTEQSSLSTRSEPPVSTGVSTTRQLQTKPRDFPQRKKKNEDGVHHLQPSSVERFIAGIWKQVFSSVEITPVSLEDYSQIEPMSTGSNIEAFREINSLCLKITKMSRCSRALETIIQAHWVDCYEARIKNIGFEKPFLSSTETKMSALREACSILKWSEKELRNRLSIWRGYKEIKDIGGWACLVFAGSGIYRFCKYRGGFGKNLATRLDRLRPSLEVAADTLHPEWRKLLSLIGQESQTLYSGHPHDWVVSDGMSPVALKSTYTQWYPDFKFTHIEDSVLDQELWGRDDPRSISGTNTAFCTDCGYFQSNNVSANECRCFPELYGACKAPVPVQVFRTPLGKNNGLIARCEFPRGSAIGEFTGLITKGMDGTDVMQGGHDENRYQIYQGNMGNYTRFINHSCAPNSQFQKFCWLGSERIILVSRGVEAGTEITESSVFKYRKSVALRNIYFLTTAICFVDTYKDWYAKELAKLQAPRFSPIYFKMASEFTNLTSDHDPSLPLQSVSVSTTAEVDWSGYDSREPPGLPQRIFHKPKLSTILSDCASILSPIGLLCFAIAIFSINGDPVQEAVHVKWRNGINIIATAFPIMFASIAGRMVYELARWRLERGATMGLLEQLIGSRTVGGVIITHFNLRIFNMLDASLLFVWAFSPLGSQSVLRILESGFKEQITNSSVVYYDTNARRSLQTYE